MFHLAPGRIDGHFLSRPKARRPSRGLAAHGFTLIELVVAFAITATLAVLGFPAARDHMVRNRATAAVAALAESRHQMEQYFLGERTYVGGPCATSLTVGSFTVVCPATGSGAPGTTGYTVIATGSGLASGLTYSIDQRGTQLTTAVPSGWTALPTGGHACWLMRKSATC